MNLHVCVSAPLLLHTPDQITSRPADRPQREICDAVLAQHLPGPPPTIRDPFAETAWASASVPSSRPRSCASVAAVQRNVRAHPPIVFLHAGSELGRKYWRMMVEPSAEMPNASALVPNLGGVEPIWNVAVWAAAIVEQAQSAGANTKRANDPRT